MLNGPGLGESSADGARRACAELCRELGLQLDFRQSDDAAQMCRWMADDSAGADGVIINPASRAHAGIAGSLDYRAAVLSLALSHRPVVEVHLDNIFAPGVDDAPPPFAARGDMGLVCGLGRQGYLLAIRAVASRLGIDGSPVRLRKHSPAPQTVYVINGPNLNLLGTREPELYGTTSLQTIEARCREKAAGTGLELRFFQSNHEGAIVDCIQEAIDVAQGVVINAAAYTHTSVAIHDALRAFAGFKLELHVSNPHLREPFRHISYVAPAVDAVVAGLGVLAYELVVELMAGVLDGGAAPGAA